mmetsp:Transcript_4845/g.15171  ORF Transcript_4845/g.15171 Transcript_4845/m.15171 type:complete len:268 (-) Transcript_4845:598-1401(-)
MSSCDAMDATTGHILWAGTTRTLACLSCLRSARGACRMARRARSANRADADADRSSSSATTSTSTTRAPATKRPRERSTLWMPSMPWTLSRTARRSASSTVSVSSAKASSEIRKPMAPSMSATTAAARPSQNARRGPPTAAAKMPTSATTEDMASERWCQAFARKAGDRSLLATSIVPRYSASFATIDVAAAHSAMFPAHAASHWPGWTKLDATGPTAKTPGIPGVVSARGTATRSDASAVSPRPQAAAKSIAPTNMAPTVSNRSWP